MKKLAVGCGVVLLVIGVSGAGIAYYLYRQLSSTVAQFAELAKIPELEGKIRNQRPFEPPASEELIHGQVEKLVSVQAEVRRRLGERIKDFETRYRDLAERGNGSLSDATVLLRTYGELPAMWLAAKRGQIDALNAAELSLEEYRWIRDQAYRALGRPYVDLDIGRMIDEARRGVLRGHGRMRSAKGPAGPESNRARIEKFRKQLEENLALAAFGL